jgi:signal transduction histidine kinase
MLPTLILAVVLATAATAMWFFAERRRRAIAQRLVLSDALLAELPVGFVYWGPDNKENASASLVHLLNIENASFEDLSRLIKPAQKSKFDKLMSALRGRGEEFNLIAQISEPERTFRIRGRRSARIALDLIWIGDITDELEHNTETEARLANAERDRDALEAIFENLPTPAWTGSASAETPVRTSRSWRDLFGGEAEQSEAGPIDSLALKAAETGEEQSGRDHFVVGGDRRLLSVTLTPVEGVGVVGQAVDETELEELTDELERHIAAHSDVLETLAVAIAIYGPDTKLSFYNTAYARLWDADPNWLNTNPTLGEELEQLRARRRLPEQSDFRAWRDNEIGLFTSLMTPREELMHLPDDRTLRNRVSPHPFGGLIFIYEDVTDRLSLEAEYNTLIEVQRQSLDNLFEAIALIGADGRLKLSNAAFKRIWEYEDSDIEGEPHVSDLIDRARPLIERSRPWDEHLKFAVARVTSREPIAERLNLNNGTVLQHATVPLPDGMVLLTFVDISDRLRVEQALRDRAEAMEAADELKTQFVANVSYELRTPLNSVIGFTQILQQGIVGDVNESQADYLNSILQSSEELLDLINDILDLATIEAGYMELDSDSFDIRVLMDGVHTLVRERARNKGLELTVTCPPDIGTMRADERRIKQVIFNLATNAINFTPADGTVDLDVEREGSDIIFTVSDSGIGIPQDQLERVFDKFERGSGAMVRESESGAGLGLSLVQSFVHLHGGKVTVKSEQDSGTTVICRIPIGDSNLRDLPISGTA